MQRLKTDECAENKRLLGAQPQTRGFYKLPQGTGVAHRPGGGGREQKSQGMGKRAVESCLLDTTRLCLPELTLDMVTCTRSSQHSIGQHQTQ